jgi:parvulin-like peptidyl-prolyl isomerase
MITCKHCGTTVPDETAVCPGCGAEMSAENAGGGTGETDAADGTTAGATTPLEAAGTEPVAGSPADPGAGESSASGASAFESSTSDLSAAGAGADAASPLGAQATPLGDQASSLGAARASTSRAAAVGAGGGTSSTTKALVVAGIAVAIALGLIAWQVVARRHRGVTLTQDDMAEIVKGMVPPQELSAIAASPEERKTIATQMRELFALAQEARAAGIADKPETKRQIEEMQTFILAQTYAQRQREAGVTNPEQLASKDEVDNFLKEPGTDQKFDQFLKDVQDMGMIPSAGGVSDEQKSQIKSDTWGPVQVVARKAKAAGLDKERRTQLLMQVQEAQVLARKYSEANKQQIEAATKATDQEVDAYIKQHPEFDESKTRAQAEDVLKRVRAGEDFGALAKQYSTDPGSKEKGGELGWFKRGMMTKSFEDAAFALKPGETSDVVESPFGFHIIQTEEKRTSKDEQGKDVEEVRARHILIKGDAGKQDNPFAPPQSPREQAKAAVEKEKRQKYIDEIARRSRVNIPDDFHVDAPPAPPRQPATGLPGEQEEQSPPAGPPAPANPHGAPNANGGKK